MIIKWNNIINEHTVDIYTKMITEQFIPLLWTKKMLDN